MSLKTFIGNVRRLWKMDIDIKEKLRDDIVGEIFYGIRPKIKSHEETIEQLLKTNLSIARFGDADISIIQGEDTPFQKYDKQLAERLKGILRNQNPKLLVGINYEYFYPPQANMLAGVSRFYRKLAPTLRKSLLPYLDISTQYYSAAFTQLRMFFLDYAFERHYANLRQIWEGRRKVLIVTNKSVVNQCSYNIYDNAKEVNYLWVPSKEAFSSYEDIYAKAVAYDKDTLIIAAAGSCSKVLADDLSKIGYRVLDLGHLMQDYDWWRKGKARSEKDVLEFFAPD